MAEIKAAGFNSAVAAMREIIAADAFTRVVATLGPRAFPVAVDFVTSPGHRYRGQSRTALGMPGAGPVKVITDRAVLDPDPESGELALTTVYPGVTAEMVQAGVGWPLVVRRPLAHAEPPTAREIDLLRHTLDPRKLYLKD